MSFLFNIVIARSVRCCALQARNDNDKMKQETGRQEQEMFIEYMQKEKL